MSDDKLVGRLRNLDAESIEIDRMLDEAADRIEADAARIKKLEALAQNFQITGPDADELVWLVLHGHGTTGQAMLNIGSDKHIVAKVALLLEEDRVAALGRPA